MNSKQRAYLRGLANGLAPIFQIGKEGISENLIKGIGEAIERQELVKVTILDNSNAVAKEAAHEIAGKIGADVVQCIGRKFVLYKESSNYKQIVLP